MSDEDSRERSPELGRRRSGSGTEAARDAAGAEDTARRKPGSSPCTRGDKGTPTGRCGCWPGRLWSWGTSHETVRRTLKKRLFLQKESPVPGTRKRSSWRDKCLKSNPTTRSVRWSAWTSSRCSWETRVPATADPTRRLRVRAGGTASIFMFCEALSSWRRATARKRRTKVDWAEEVASLRPLRELRAPSCATTSTPARRERSAKRPARARELV